MLQVSCKEIFGSAVDASADWVGLVAGKDLQPDETFRGAFDYRLVEAGSLLDVLTAHRDFPVADKGLDHGVVSQREADHDALDDVYWDAFHW